MRWIISLSIACIGCAVPEPVNTTDWQSALKRADAVLLAAVADTQSELRSNTETLTAIKSQLDTIEASLVSQPTDNSEEVIQSTELTPAGKNANESQPVTGLVAAPAGVPLLISTTVGCAPCERLKQDVAAGLFAGFDVKFATDWQPDKYPAIRFKSESSSSGWGAIYGYDGNTLAWLRSKLLNQSTPVQAVASVPVVRQSHGDLVALHNQLHGGGNWTWPGGTMASLESHLRESHGVQSAGGAPLTGAMFQNRGAYTVTSQQPVVRFVSPRQSGNRWSYRVSRSACPSGACP
jgi:hypothetical protein